MSLGTGAGIGWSWPGGRGIPDGDAATRAKEGSARSDDGMRARIAGRDAPPCTPLVGSPSASRDRDRSGLYTT